MTVTTDNGRVFTPPGDPVSPPASRSSSRHSLHRNSPVPMLSSEPAVMSSFSSDMDPDLTDVLRKLQPLPAPVSPVSASQSMESPSGYPAPAVPIESSAISVSLLARMGQ